MTACIIINEYLIMNAPIYYGAGVYELEINAPTENKRLTQDKLSTFCKSTSKLYYML